MSYTPNTWSTGDTITAAKLNNIEQGIVGAESSGSEWDAVIRLTHETSGNDNTTNLIPTIVSGTYTEIRDLINNGGFPCILVQYDGWTRYSAPMAYVTYLTDGAFGMTIAGYFPRINNYSIIGELYWRSNNTLGWA